MSMMLLAACAAQHPEPVDLGDTGHAGLPSHLLQARELVEAVPVDANTWSLPTTVELGPDEWSSHAKCSGLVTRIIEASAELELQERWACDTTVPLAWHWHARITGALPPDPRLHRIHSAYGLRPGDLLSIRYRDCDPDLLSCGYENDACDGGSTGHIALVDGRPSVTDEGEFLVWSVPVLDSARTGHTADMDTRWGEDGWTDGVGRGRMRVITDREGQPLAYAWSDIESSELVTAADADIAFGRWEDEP